MASYQVLRHPHSLSKALQNFLQTEEGCDFRRAMSLVPPNWKVYVMGGLPRDLLLRQIRGIDVKPTDIDLVVEGANSVAAVRDRLGAAYVSSNTFGGAKCQFRPEGIIFDIWRVEDHANSVIAFKPYTIEQLLKHNLLDVDAILWDPKTDSLHDCGCLNAIQVGRIGLMGPQGISKAFPAAQVAHVLLVAFKTKFRISHAVRRFIVDASDHSREDVLKIVKRKLPRAENQIQTLWEEFLRGGTRVCPSLTRVTIPQRARGKRSFSSQNTTP